MFAWTVALRRGGGQAEGTAAIGNNLNFQINKEDRSIVPPAQIVTPHKALLASLYYIPYQIVMTNMAINQIFGALSERELAIFTWLLIGLVYFSFSKKMRPARTALKNVSTALKNKKIISFFILSLTWSMLSLYILHFLNIAKFRHTFSFLYWYAGVGTYPISKLKELSKDTRNALVKISIQNITVTAIISFFIESKTFSYTAEFIFFPFMFFLSLMIAYSQTDKNHKSANNIFVTFLSIVVFVLLILKIFDIYSNSSTLLAKEAFLDFIFPGLMTISYIPFVLVFTCFAVYETVFLRLSFLNNRQKIPFNQKILIISKFKYNLQLLERWSPRYSWLEEKSLKGITLSIHNFFEQIKHENNPSIPDKREGWPPHKAKEFLKDYNLSAGNYDPYSDETWSAHSPITPIGNEILSPSIYYIIEGTKSVADNLILNISVHKQQHTRTAHEYFKKVAKQLSLQATGKIPRNKFWSISTKEHSTAMDHYILSIKKEKWSIEGHDIRFKIAILKSGGPAEGRRS